METILVPLTGAIFQEGEWFFLMEVKGSIPVMKKNEV